MKLVIDTNVILSGVFFHGTPSKLLEVVVDSLYQVVLSEEIIDEYMKAVTRYSIRNKIPDISEQLSIIDLLIASAVIIDARGVVTPTCADPDDIKFLQAAIESQAKYLISGDKHLLDVKQYPGGMVVKPREFLDLL